MTREIPVSVIIVSHGRPALLRRALIGVSQLFYRPFEVVVVADTEGLKAIADLPFAESLKTAEQSLPNISAARNIGANLAGGDVLAYIDDDAVPEPSWLHYLTQPFSSPKVLATTGTVLGRNGISVQWANRVVDPSGVAEPFSGDLAQGQVVKLEGTNMAIRRSALEGLGGFDEWFSFFLDETDFSRRLKTGIVLAPKATVHHGFAASARRSSDRMPTDLYEIGRSSASFLKKHAPAELAAGLENLHREQSERLGRFLKQNLMSNSQREDLLQRLDLGIEEGKEDGEEQLPGIAPKPDFFPLSAPPRHHHKVLSGRWFQKTSLLQQARREVADGHVVSLFLFEPTIRAHRVEFLEPGIWLQTGGLFGPSVRSEPRFRLWSFRKRVAKEQARLNKIRWIS